MTVQHQLQKLNFSHDALMLWIFENPHRSLKDAALFFNYSPEWIRQIVRTDIFQAEYQKRYGELSATLMQGVKEKLETASEMALDALIDKIPTVSDPRILVDATDKLLHRMGYAPNKGAMVVNQTNVQASFTVEQGVLAEARQMMHQSAARESSTLLIQETKLDERDQELFEQGDEIAGMQPCMKRPMVVSAKKMTEPFRVVLENGTLDHGEAGDYIMRGVKGELYMCPGDSFESSYDFISEEDAEAARALTAFANKL